LKFHGTHHFKEIQLKIFSFDFFFIGGKFPIGVDQREDREVTIDKYPGVVGSSE